MLMLLVMLPLLSGASGRAEPLFSAQERTQIVRYWGAPERYRIGLPEDSARNGVWQVRLTPEASIWFLAYQRALVGREKTPPTQDVKAGGERADWEKWVEAKLERDRWQAQQTADAANTAIRQMFNEEPPAPPMARNAPSRGETRGAFSSRSARRAQANEKGASPPDPGLIPASLLEAVGNPPPFAAAVTPLQYTVTFDDGDVYRYTDHVPMRPRYAYYRFSQGTAFYGTMLRDMPDEQLDRLFTAAGMSRSDARVCKAVSRLEGGFEAVNTYDTGYISIGFIQFVTMEDGRHSLMEVLAKQKAEKPEAFRSDFRRFGIEVNADGALTVVDPATGAELTGAEAVQRVIADKRLTAVFQRAGRRSEAFRVAQIQVARQRYWPAEDPVTVQVNRRTLTGKVSDIIRSEAGMATLFDRKVNRGNIEPFAAVTARVMEKYGLRSLSEAATYEREIVAALKYRADFLADKSLSQPR